MTDDYLFVGGYKDGVRMTLSEPAAIIRVPVPQPVEVARKVIPYRRTPWESLTDHVQEYRRFGRTYWWDGLIDDAKATMAVSDELLVGGASVRRLIREELRRYLEDLAPGKGLHRIIWRITPGDRMFAHTVSALVGPRAVERGLFERSERRTAIGVLDRAVKETG